MKHTGVEVADVTGLHADNCRPGHWSAVDRLSVLQERSGLFVCVWAAVGAGHAVEEAVTLYQRCVPLHAAPAEVLLEEQSEAEYRHVGAALGLEYLGAGCDVGRWACVQFYPVDYSILRAFYVAWPI